MSFLDMRRFTNMLLILGYHEHIYMESFRTSNFVLMAKLLAWIAKRYDPDVDIPFKVDTESERVLFIKAVGEFMVTKVNVKLNLKHLYQADAYAVKEMLKITRILYDAQKAASSKSDSDRSKFKFDQWSKIAADVKMAHQLASEITAQGATICGKLRHELEMRDKREAALAQPLKIAEMEKAVNAAIIDVKETFEKTKELLNKVVSDKAGLEAKIKKQKEELKRTQKRLEELQYARPVYMDVYDKIENEMMQQFEIYAHRFQTLHFLEQQLKEHSRRKQEHVQEIRKYMEKMQNKKRAEDKKLMGIEESDEETDNEKSDTEERQPVKPSSTQRAHTPGTDHESDTEDSETEEGQPAKSFPLHLTHSSGSKEHDDIEDSEIEEKTSNHEPHPHTRSPPGHTYSTVQKSWLTSYFFILFCVSVAGSVLGFCPQLVQFSHIFEDTLYAMQGYAGSFLLKACR